MIKTYFTSLVTPMRRIQLGKQGKTEQKRLPFQLHFNTNTFVENVGFFFPIIQMGDEKMLGTPLSITAVPQHHKVPLPK